MDKFVFTVDGEHTTVECEGSIEEIAGEVGHLANAIFSAYMKSDPILASYFKILVQQLMTSKDSPVWKPRKSQEGDIDIVQNTFGEGDGE